MDIYLLSDSDLDRYRSEPKKKSSSTRRKQKLGHFEQQFELVSVEDSSRQFRIFTRCSTSNEGVFSVGLVLIFPDKELVLCRYNSGHHGHRNRLEKTRVPPQNHKHITTERYIRAGLDPDGYAEPRSDYTTMQEALAKLLQECNIEGIPAGIVGSPRQDSSTQQSFFE